MVEASEISTLIKKGVDAKLIYAFVRNATRAEHLRKLGVNIVFGDYNNYSSMANAFFGIDKLLFVSSGEMVNRSEQHLQVIRAARKAGVKHLIYTSQLHRTYSDNSAIRFVLKSHLVTETSIMMSGMDYTILRNGVYLDLIPMLLGDRFLESGIIFLPAGQGSIAFTLRSELAEVAAHILLSQGHEDKIYELGGSDVSFKEVAAILSEITGRMIVYSSTDIESYIDSTIASGVPKKYAQMLAAFAQAASERELECGSPHLEKLLGRKPAAVAGFLREVYE
ncbi:SDR family NAD(P)-dependent oxidoreductase [Sphingobacterium puteale]|uniref:SDR family NAD(P)-dependent oxidoreductase n=1 Tax=Sphingobacterium puteale TaxID=2420510 RepID=A0A420VPI4_9SPHI|nr:NAD(P)H-binding protein [Sphingobacterium puteale]RKO68239.1 SDR family NAD(P)-dependent oxidoreductase [Sphingobacterium puteale]